MRGEHQAIAGHDRAPLLQVVQRALEHGEVPARDEPRARLFPRHTLRERLRPMVLLEELENRGLQLFQNGAGHQHVADKLDMPPLAKSFYAPGDRSGFDPGS
jgi:hypothetical protein